MSENQSLIKIDGDISRPLTRLIEKVSDAIGTLYEPCRIRKLAKAEVEANKIKALGEIETTEIQKRAIKRLVREEGKKQENIENLLKEAGPHLHEDSKPEEIENDWIANFFEKAKLVSDQEMRSLWAKILAGEANQPGTYSKRTVNFISDLDRIDASHFTKFCSFTIQAKNDFESVIYSVIYNEKDDIYMKNGISFATLNHLDDIGLIKFDSNKNFYANRVGRTLNYLYFGRPIILEFKNPENNTFKFGMAVLTRIGKELAPIANAQTVDGFYEYLLSSWTQLGYKVIQPTVR